MLPYPHCIILKQYILLMIQCTDQNCRPSIYIDVNNPILIGHKMQHDHVTLDIESALATFWDDMCAFVRTHNRESPRNLERSESGRYAFRYGIVMSMSDILSKCQERLRTVTHMGSRRNLRLSSLGRTRLHFFDDTLAFFTQLPLHNRCSTSSLMYQREWVAAYIDIHFNFMPTTQDWDNIFGSRAHIG